MNSRKIAFYGTILIVIVGILALSQFLAHQKPSAKSLLFFPAYSDATVGALSITDQGGTVRLEKKSGTWSVVTQATQTSQASPLGQTPGVSPAGESAVPSVSSFPADSASMAIALEKIKEMKMDQLISDNIAKQEALEVDTLKGLLLQVWNDKGTLIGSVRIGKSGADYSSNFVRPVASNKVYSVGGSPRFAFFTDVKRWRDKSVLSFDKASVQKVSIQKKGGTLIELVKTADTTMVWQVTGPSKVSTKAKQSEVDGLLETLSKFMCADVETDASLTDSAMGFTVPELIVTTELKNNDRPMITVGAKKTGPENQFWVRVSGKSSVYLVSDMDIQKLDKNESGLAEVPPAPRGAVAVPKNKK